MVEAAKACPVPRYRVVAIAMAGGLILSACSGDGGLEIGAPGQPTAVAGEEDRAPDTPPNTADPNDTDQDGVTDDNCVGTFNPNQTDSDGDGIGDLCDEVVPVPRGCGPAAEATTVATTLAGDADGDTDRDTACVPIEFRSLISDIAPNAPILFETDEYIVFDLEPGELLAIEQSLAERGLTIDEVVSFEAIDTAALIGRRIELQPERALDTVVPGLLGAVDPTVLERVPDEVLADQPDEKLREFPTEFWITADDSTIDAIGAERLVEINPSLVQLVPGRFDLRPGIELQPPVIVDD